MIAVGVADKQRAVDFWRRALGYELVEGGSGGFSTVLAPPGSAGPMLALHVSETPPPDHPRVHLDLHVRDAAEQKAEVRRLVGLGAALVDWDS